MKILIWIGCWLAFSMLNSLMQACLGFSLGIFMWIFIIPTAKHFCEKLDGPKEESEEEPQEDPAAKYPSASDGWTCHTCGTVNSFGQTRCKNCGKE